MSQVGEKPAFGNSVLELISITDLRELKKHCAKASISKKDLADFILACASPGMPILHFRYHRTFVPEHLHLSDNNLDALASNGIGKMSTAAQKTANKVFATLEERRMLSGHMFQGTKHWHFLYFDNRDVARRNNHWVAGAHVHLINWLTSQRTAEEIWQEFSVGNPKMKGSLHLRFDNTHI